MARQWGASFQWFNGRFWTPTRPAHKAITASTWAAATGAACRYFHKAVTASTWTAANGAAARYFHKHVIPARTRVERTRLEVWPISSAREIVEE